MDKNVDGSRQAFVWNLVDGVPQLLSDSQVQYIVGPGGLPLEQISAPGQVLFFHPDQLGSTRLLTDTQGQFRAGYTFDPNGNLNHRQGEASTRFLYAGQYQDQESTLYYMQARYYDPVTSQWMTVDPAASLTRSPYSYVFGNALNSVDPTGLICLEFWNKDKCNNPFIGLAVGFANSSIGERANAIADRYSWGLTSTVESWASVGYDRCSANWQGASNSLAGTLSAAVGAATAVTLGGGGAVIRGAAAGIRGVPAVLSSLRGSVGLVTGGGIRIGGTGIKIALHDAHHVFDFFGRELPHLQFNWWKIGVKNSGGVKRIPLPYIWPFN
jgi:RHS repeat-associated protein